MKTAEFLWKEWAWIQQLCLRLNPDYSGSCFCAVSTTCCNPAQPLSPEVTSSRTISLDGEIRKAGLKKRLHVHIRFWEDGYKQAKLWSSKVWSSWFPWEGRNRMSDSTSVSFWVASRDWTSMHVSHHQIVKLNKYQHMVNGNADIWRKLLYQT